MEKLRRVHYTPEFKLQAVQMVDEDGLGVTEVARRLDMSSKTLENWVTAFQKEGMVKSKQKSPTAEQEEISRLRQENLRLKMECDILKKAAAYFAKESL